MPTHEVSDFQMCLISASAAKFKVPPLAMLIPGCDYGKNKDEAFMAGQYI